MINPLRLRRKALLGWVVAALSIPLVMPGISLSGPRSEGRGPGLRLLERNAERLGLDDATLAQMRAVAEAEREQSRALRESQRRERRVLRELMKAPKPDRPVIMNQLDVLGQLETDLRKQRMSGWLDIQALLTPEQREELASLRAEMRERFKEGRRGGRFGKGFGKRFERGFGEDPSGE